MASSWKAATAAAAANWNRLRRFMGAMLQQGGRRGQVDSRALSLRTVPYRANTFFNSAYSVSLNAPVLIHRTRPSPSSTAT